MSAQPALQAFVCPMHAGVRRSTPGRCPVCGMALVGTAIDDLRPYLLTVETRPAVVRAGQAVELELAVTDPKGQAVRAFVRVHERPFHLFIVSEDLGSFEHVHPTLGRDGRLLLSTTLPHPGRYQLFADFFPEGGVPQLMARSIVTADHRAPLAQAHLVCDERLVQRVGDVELAIDPVAVVAGQAATFRLHVRDGKGAAVPLEPYLGALAHVLAVSEDLRDAIHAHAERDPDGALRFELLLPRAGRYRMWVQVSSAGRLLTAPFTWAAAAPGAAYLH